MKIKEKMFGFEIAQKPFPWINQRPVPPRGYIEFNSKKAHCQSGKCPNCGTEKPGIGPQERSGGFQDRQIQNLIRALDKKNKLDMDHQNWKSSYELFSIDLIPEYGEMGSMLKCHPSRYGIEEFMCCGVRQAKIGIL